MRDSQKDHALLAALQTVAGGRMSEANPTDQIKSQDSDEYEIEAMKKRLKEMEEEAEKFKQMQSQDDKDRSGTGSLDNKEEIDARSVYVGNVDYSTTPEELQKHFQSCGIINRITILCDKFTGHPKGFSYVEFADAEHVNNAVALNESVFKGRPLKVTAKRTNVPAFIRGRGRGGRGRGSYRGSYRGRGRGASYTPY